MNLEISNRLVELRRGRGMSQEELAARLGVSRQAVSKWERAESSPDTDNLIALARLYGVSLDELLLAETPSYGTAQATETAQAAQTLYESNEADQVFDAAGAWEEAEEARRQARAKQRRKLLLRFPYPVLVTILFLAVGFSLGWWHPAWMLYLTVPIYYCVVASL